MRTTVDLDPDLIARAIELTAITQKTQLLHDALRALIAQESQRRLALLGGTDSAVKKTRRRRT